MSDVNICYILLITVFSFRQNDGFIHTQGYPKLFDLIRTLPYLFIPKNTPEGYMRTLEVITFEGYSGENHIVKTEDGYLCNIYRLQRKSGINKNYPVMLVNGLPSSSIIWLRNQNKSLAFSLADAGYDVWLTNFRGTSYCMKHVRLTSKDPEFWKFSWAENGNYDLSSMIDYIINITDKPKLNVISHSKGSTSMLALLANRTEYNDKIQLLVAMSPIIDLRGATSLFVTLSLIHLTPLLKLFPILFNIYYYPPLPSPGIDPCKLFPGLCTVFLILLEGGISQEFDFSKSADFYASLPDYTSIQDLYHYYQVYMKGQFEAYDYKSPKENRKHYGSVKPPIYNLSKISTPTAVIWGNRDEISSPSEAKRISKALGNLVLFKEVPFNHLDFFLAIDLNKLLSEPLLRILQKYQT